MSVPISIIVEFDSERQRGIFRSEFATHPGWLAVQNASVQFPECIRTSNMVELPWYSTLNIIREYSPISKVLGIKFKPNSAAGQELNNFARRYSIVQQAKARQNPKIETQEIIDRLRKLGFVQRTLKDFQLRDLQDLLSLPNGANFSVPGAGKTTVSLALHLLFAENNPCSLLVVSPKSAFPAWAAVAEECLSSDAIEAKNIRFLCLAGMNRLEISRYLSSGRGYYITNYEHYVQVREVIESAMSVQPFHLILDESHRMKAGFDSQRGAALLSVAGLPVRKDILSGTPMPQSPKDLESQFEFLWPGAGIGNLISRTTTPREAIQGLYVRTTKEDLGLPPVARHFHKIGMSDAQASLYAIVTKEVARQLSRISRSEEFDVVRARRSVLRLLQLSSNPSLAIRSISDSLIPPANGVIKALLAEGLSNKMRYCIDLVRENALAKRKTVVWTIFTQNILDLEASMSDLNPVSLYGAIPSGSAQDLGTREGRLRRFHQDDSCFVLIANPAASGEGISLHEVCHDAVYLDRSYVSTHYLQSLDRIHRLGLSPDTITNVNVLQTSAPAGMGSIDFSVSRRLLAKLRALEQLLNDTDIRAVALDEESAQDPIDYSLDLEDVLDLIEELEGKHVFVDNEGV